jgi:hypothetical protein
MRSSAVVETSGRRAAIMTVKGNAQVGAWFPAAASAWRYGRMWAAWWRLRQLWGQLTEIAPDVRLPTQPGTRLGACYRLHRRVIEIRDAELALRPFQDSRAAHEAAVAARSAGLLADERDAVFEAVLIVSALDGRRRGAEPCSGAGTGCAVRGPCNDLESEVGRLLLVSRAVRRSPIVRRAARAARQRQARRRAG